MVRSTARKVDKLGSPQKKPTRPPERTGGGQKTASATAVSEEKPEPEDEVVPAADVSPNRD